MSVPDKLLDEPSDPRIPCEDCGVALDHHTGFMRLWKRMREVYFCQNCGDDYLSTLNK